jgi:hypothetical protein
MIRFEDKEKSNRGPYTFRSTSKILYNVLYFLLYKVLNKVLYYSFWGPKNQTGEPTPLDPKVKYYTMYYTLYYKEYNIKYYMIRLGPRKIKQGTLHR